MVESAADIDSVRTLAVVLAADGPWPADRALRIAEEVGTQLAALHATGQIHGALSTETLAVDSTARVTICSTPQESSVRVTNAHEWTHPELRNIQHIQLPTTIVAAHTVLRQSGVELDPCEIDVYQLLAILCRMLTADSLETYLRSPRAKARVPVAIRPLLDRAGSRLPQDRIHSMEGLMIGFHEASTRLRTGTDQPASESAGVAENGSEMHSEAGRDTSGILRPSQLLPDTSLTLPPGPSVHRAQANHPHEVRPPANASIIPTRDRPRATDRLPFDRLGHYQIVERIGCGGMGDVYRGYEQSLDRVVAIKVLPTELARQEEFVRRFRAEATAAARLVHPNIIQIYFIGEDSGHHFFAMQFVDGESLADMLARHGKLNVDETIAVMSQLLAGLAMAHRLGMVHRDIKPANILLDRVHHRALVADFGLVKSTSNPGGKTATGIVMGTVDYIAPEQARAQAIDSRADLYSLGVLMYHMLTGKLPFEGDSPTAILFQHVYDVPKRVDEITQEVPAPLATVVARLLEKLPERRYQTADEVLTDLRAFREGRPLPGLANSPAAAPVRRQTAVLTLPWFEELRPVPDAAIEPPAGGWWGRLRRHALSLFRVQAPGLLAHLLNTQQQFDGAIAEYARRRDELQRLAHEAQGILAEFETQAKAHRAASVEKKKALDAASANEDSSDPSDSSTELDRIADELDQKAAEQREQLEAMAVRLAQVNATLNQLQSQRAILAARLLAAEAHLKLSGGRSHRRRWRRWAIASAVMFAGLVVVVLSFVPGSWEQVRKYTPDSVKGYGRVVAVKPTSSTQRKSAVPVGANLVGAEVTQGPWANSVFMYTLTCLFDDGTVRTSRIHKDDREINDARTTILATSTSKANKLAVTTDGETLAVAGEDHAIHIWNLKERREVRRLEGGFEQVDAMKFSLDGSKLLFAARSGAMCLWDVKLEKEIKRLNLGQYRSWIDDLSWSADEHRLLMGARISGNFSMSLWSLDSDQEVQVFETSATRQPTHQVMLGPDPFALSLAEQQVHLWDVRSGKELRAFGEKLRAAVFSQDVRSALTMGNDRVVTIWNARTGQSVKTLGLAQDVQGRLAMSPDGRFGVAVARNGEIQLWNLPLPRPDGQIGRLDTNSPVQCVALSPDGVKIAFGTNTNLFTVDDPERRFLADTHSVGGRVVSISYSADGGRLLYGTGMVNAKTNWIGGRGTYEYLRDSRRYRADSDQIVTAVYHPDGSRVISACADGSVVVWSAQSEAELNRIDVGLTIHGVALFPSGSEMLIAANDNDIRQWNLDSGKEVRQLKGHTFHVSSVAISEDGGIAVSGAKDRTVRTWDLNTGAPLKRLAAHTGYVNSVAISADGQLVLSGSDDTTVRLWDTRTGEVLRTFDGHRAPVRSVHMSSDGNRGLSGSDDGTVRLWDLRIPVSEDSAAPGTAPETQKNDTKP